MEQIIATGRVERGRIGISLQDLQKGRNGGAVIADIASESPAEKAGLRKGDIVTMVDDRPVRSAAQLRNTVGLARIGQELKLTIQRSGSQSNVMVKVAPQQESSNASTSLIQ
jgi:serine protease Do